MKVLHVTLIGALISSFAIAESIQFNDSVRVIKSEPVHRTVTTRTPYQECWDEQVQVHQGGSGGIANDGTIGGVLGGVAGGILGNQVGGGSGKTAATVGGAIIGTLVGKNLGEGERRPPQDVYETQRKCVTRYKEEASEKLVGYKNIANYKGYTITKFSDQPLETIHLSVNAVY